MPQSRNDKTYSPKTDSPIKISIFKSIGELKINEGITVSRLEKIRNELEELGSIKEQELTIR